MIVWRGDAPQAVRPTTRPSAEGVRLDFAQPCATCPAVATPQNGQDTPTKKPRRGPNCGAPTPTPVPLRIWYTVSNRLITSKRTDGTSSAALLARKGNA